VKRNTSVLTLLAALCWGAPAFAQPQTLADTGSVSIAQGLEHVLQRDVSHYLAPYLVLRAGESGDPSFAPLLKEVVESYTPEKSTNSVVSASLVSLYELGERDYLMEQVIEWKENAVRATYALKILAFDSSDRLVKEVEEVFEGEGFIDGRLYGGLSRVREMNRLRGVFNDPATPLKQQIEMAIDGAGEAWSVFSGPSEHTINAEAVLARKWLRQISDEAPEAVARAIADLRVADYPEKEPEARAYLARYTNDEVRSILGIPAE
jgi:hypothetical protein